MKEPAKKGSVRFTYHLLKVFNKLLNSWMGWSVGDSQLRELKVHWDKITRLHNYKIFSEIGIMSSLRVVTGSCNRPASVVLCQHNTPGQLAWIFSWIGNAYHVFVLTPKFLFLRLEVKLKPCDVKNKIKLRQKVSFTGTLLNRHTVPTTIYCKWRAAPHVLLK